ncbi:L-threonylcarbamoyladenylate synthase [Leptodesmis sichuanensis]|uniref:L-threonylcarbamoyladenylate synthase n=1 Tax=Leptodesmis sichuanensis TaxID=2906798 RepID=UPI001F1EE146|nr:L-threonylcarbamoyladenylate synthase [Leptodesmis sichuanensis]UIE36335.1 L-threonylcarbamoyladenylate synthase [Leptodesmis sichuanensis A121]
MTQVSFEALVAGASSGQDLISFPTDTVPALAARPDRASLIFAAKQRSLDKPLILMAAEVKELWSYVAGSSEERQIWQQMADRYLPGALTLVLPASDRVSPELNPKDPTTIGVRVPNHPIARAILARTGPLATTSANLSGQPALQTMAEIEAQFPQVLTLSPSDLQTLQLTSPLTSSSSPSGVPSTVVRWTESGWEVLRQGAVVLDE